MSTIGNVAVAKNSGADVGIRREINIIEGANVTLTIVDDPTNHRVNITIAAGGGASASWIKAFYPAVDTDDVYGTYANTLMPDNLSTTLYQTFVIPEDITTITTAVVIVIPEGTGNIRRSASTNFAEICANEDYQTHTDSIAAGQVAVTDDEVECLDISTALTGALGGDIVGISFTRSGEHASDTVNADVHYLGIYIEGTI